MTAPRHNAPRVKISLDSEAALLLRKAAGGEVIGVDHKR
jgi:hypothetical protein